MRGRTRDEIRDAPFLAKLRQCIAEERERFLRRELPPLSWTLYKRYDTDGDRSTFETAYFERRRRLFVLSISVWFWERPEDIAALEDCIWAICDEYSWCLPAHMGGTSLLPPATVPDIAISCEFGISAGYSGWAEEGGGIIDNRTRLDLFACETGFALAECCAMLGSLLAAAVVSRARSEALRRIIRSYREHGGLWNWEVMNNNWCAVTAGSIAGTAMYLIKDDMLLAGLLSKLIPVLNRYLHSFTVAGVSTEGLSYWTYGMSFYVSAMDLLLLRTDGGIDLFKSSRFERIAAFQQHCYFPGGAFLHFSDANDSDAFRLGLSCYLAEHISDIRVPAIPYHRALSNNPADPCGRFCAGLRDILWAREHIPFAGEEPRFVSFPKAQWLLCVGAYDTGFAAKGGNNGEPHNHNDVGSFIYYRKGRMILCDLGAGEYSKEYFRNGRYDILCNSSLGHNVPIVDGKVQKAGREYRARSCVFGADAEMLLDIAPVYGQTGLAVLERRFRFDVQTGVLSVRDTFVFSGDIPPVTERLVSLIEPYVDHGNLFIPCEDQAVFISLTGDESVERTVSEIRRNVHRKKGADIPVYTIDTAIVSDANRFTVEMIIGGKPFRGSSS
jgi:hypothetical protein